MIADEQNYRYDSAVFLEAGSFNLGGAVKLTSRVTGNTEETVYEGCDNGYFRFVRENPESMDFPLTVNYKVSESSTATEGLDFAASFDYLDRIRRLSSSGHNIVLVTHHLNEIPPEVDRVIVLKSGQIAADGPKNEVLDSALLSSVYETPIRVAEFDGYYLAYPG